MVVAFSTKVLFEYSSGEQPCDTTQPASFRAVFGADVSRSPHVRGRALAVLFAHMGLATVLPCSATRGSYLLRVQER